ncbi:MAG: WYL domain-containing protein [Gammaproteobacteria bacterium]|nr:WYL domain-containing protein [Gammaproteobacteria bacterium]
MNVKRAGAREKTQWDLVQRYRLIETVALWEGRLTTNHIQAAFGVGRQQASRDIGGYNEHTSNLVYDNALRGYKPAPGFTPHFTRGSADEYLQQLASSNALASYAETLALPETPTHLLTIPQRRIDPAVLRPIIQACREKLRVDIRYLSMNSPNGEERIISPHALINTGSRWHVRAWCELKQDYRDFVLSRIRDVPDLNGAATHGAETDIRWQTQLELRLVPNPKLTFAQQRVIAEDWGMSEGFLAYPVRGALAQYGLDLLQLTVDEERWSAEPLRYPVVVENGDQVKPYLFA